jgi:hypothetical protein
MKPPETLNPIPPGHLSSRKGCLGFLSSSFLKARTFLKRLSEAFTTLDYRYESKSRILGWPLLAINLGFNAEEENMRHAKGVFAIGTKATGIFSLGVFMARGIVAIGVISLGVGAVGVAGIAVVTVSVVGLGGISVSVFAFGYLAIGILAIGYRSVGILAIGREAVGIIALGQAVRTLFAF